MRTTLLSIFLITIFLLSCGSEEGALIPADGGSPSGEQIPPLLSITTPADDSVFYTDTVTVSGTATDNTIVSNVYLRIDSGLWSPVILSGSNWSTNLVIPNGSHIISIFAMDTNRNCSSTNILSLQINVDETVPTVSILAPSAGSSINTTNITVSGTAQDNRALDAVFLQVDGGGFAPVTLSSGNWNTNFNLPEGSHSVAVYATDTNGNCSFTNSLSFTIALDAPSVTITAPANNSFTNTSDITVSGTASVNSGSLTGVEAKIGSGSYTAASSGDGWATWTKTVALSEGSNTITARVSADSGKQSTASAIVILDTTSPVISSIISKDNTNRFKADNSFYFSISSASDPSGISRIVVLKDGVFYTNKIVSLSSLSSEQVTISALNSAGTYQFEFYIVDGAGNVSTTNSMTISTFYLPVIKATSPSDNSTTGSTTITVSGTASITSGTISLIRVKVGDSGSWVTASSSDGWATWNANMTLSPGSNKIIAEAVSAAGDTDQWTIWSVYCDTVAPAASITSPAAGFSVETNTAFMISASSSDDHSGISSLILTVDGSVWTNISSPGSAVSMEYPGFSTAGSHTLAVYAVDGAGNYSATNSVSVSATEPFLQVNGITWTPGGSGAGTLSGDATLTLDATLYYVVVNKGLPPTSAELISGTDYTSSGESVTVMHSGSSVCSAGSAWFGGYFSGLYDDQYVHVYCAAKTSGGQLSAVRFAGSFMCNSPEVLPIMQSLIFTEYIEGDGDNKALEIYNGTGKPVALDQYWIHFYANSMTTPFGSGWAAGRSGAVLGQGEFYVFCNSGADSAIFDAAQKDVGSLDYNGNDTIVLLNPDGQVVDSIGKIGENPDSSTGWTGNGVQTVDRTLRRKLTVRKGDSNPNDSFDPSVEWVSHPNGTFDGLGSWQE